MHPSREDSAVGEALPAPRLADADSPGPLTPFRRRDPSRDHVQLAARLRQFREGRTYVEIASRLNMSRETLRRYFSGDRPSAVFLIALCREYNLSPAWLMLGEGPMYAWPEEPRRVAGGRS